MNIGIITHNYSKNEYDHRNAGVFVSDFSKDLGKRVKNVFIYNLDSKKKLGGLKWWNPIDEIYAFAYFVKSVKDINKFAKKNDIDFFLSMWALPGGLIAYYNKKRYGTPYGVWCLGSDIYIYAKIIFIRFLIIKILKNADICFGNSFDICKEAEKLSGRKCVYLPTLTKMDSYKKRANKLRIKDFNFLFVGRLEHVKGPDILIEAAKMLKEKITDDFHIYYIGDGSLMGSLRNKINRHNLDSKISLLGNIGDRKILFEYLNAADALVIPSRSESLPLVFTEAMRSGVPVIASDVGDLPYFIKNNKVGLTFHSGNVQELAKLLKYAVSNKKTFKKSYNSRIKTLANNYKSSSIISSFLDYISDYV